jgi:fatty acid desaturase
MRPVPVITDPTFDKQKKYNFIDKMWLGMLRDERDLPFVYLTIKITFIMMAVGVALYFPMPWYAWWSLALAYFVFNNFVFKGPFGLMLHCTSHRKWFKKEYEALNHYLPWIVGPFFGQTPLTYASHHLGMHHVENNLEDDESTTMYYQRDSFKDFMKYFGRFFFKGITSLMQYFTLRKLPKMKRRVVRGELLFYAMCIGLSFISWQATLWVFILPFFISRFIMMVGNFAQHSFVDFDDPGNNFKNSINCINTPYNKKCWNDGYHIDHHIRPAMHWTEYPIHFQENLEDFRKNKALVFEELDFLKVWLYLMKKRYDKLADHLVNINGEFKSDEEAIALMKSRTAKMPKRGITMKNFQNSGKSAAVA